MNSIPRLLRAFAEFVATTGSLSVGLAALNVFVLDEWEEKWGKWGTFEVLQHMAWGFALLTGTLFTVVLLIAEAAHGPPLAPESSNAVIIAAASLLALTCAIIWCTTGHDLAWLACVFLGPPLAAILVHTHGRDTSGASPPDRPLVPP